MGFLAFVVSVGALCALWWFFRKRLEAAQHLLQVKALMWQDLSEELGWDVAADAGVEPDDG